MCIHKLGALRNGLSEGSGTQSFRLINCEPDWSALNAVEELGRNDAIDFGKIRATRFWITY
jgi:hypothetical protein